jgi:hypothetical protein
MQWDWYQATIPDRPEPLISALACLSDQPSIRDGNGLHGYRNRTDILDQGNVVASILHGGQNGHPNAWASGEFAPAFAEVLRSVRPVHFVTRCDSCLDFEEPGLFDRVSALLLDFADRTHLKTSLAGDWHGREDGRTLYLGSPSSLVRLRWYEKGRQLAKLLAIEGIHRPDWCRLELRVRPEGFRRELAASCPPEEVWGFSRWSSRALRTVSAIDVRRAAPSLVTKSSDDRAFRHMVSQYAGVLLRMQEKIGTPADVGISIFQEIERMIAEKEGRLH